VFCVLVMDVFTLFLCNETFPMVEIMKYVMKFHYFSFSNVRAKLATVCKFVFHCCLYPLHKS
jgi:hypothetical protein